MKKVTLKDIAKELGVTVGTVSHALNGMRDISEETKKKVLKTARKMGYITNGPAASLRSGKTNTIAVIVPDISNPHIAYQIKLIEDKMKEAGYSVIILNTNEDEETEYRAMVTALGRQVDGILFCPSQHSTDNVDFLQKTEVPFALIGRYFAKMDTDYICADDLKGGYLAGKYLIEKGCKSPIYVGAFKYIEPAQNRFWGLQKAFGEKGLPLDDTRYVEISPKTGALEHFTDLLEEKQISFDSVVAFSDILAFEILSHIQKSVPVIGFDAIGTHLYLPFDYASIGMVNGGWADKATEVLLAKIKEKSSPVHELIDVKLFEFHA